MFNRTTDSRHGQDIYTGHGIFDYIGEVTSRATHKARFPDFSWPWGRRVAQKALRRMSDIRPDVIIATHPFPGTLRAASLIGQTTGVPWVADMRDPFHNDPQLTDEWVCRGLLPVEQGLLRRATCIVTINSHLADMLATSRGVQIISNCYDDSEMQVPPARRNDYARVQITYTGSILESSTSADLCDAIGALSPRKKEEAVIMLDYYGPSFRKLDPWEQILHEKGIELSDHGFVSTEECAKAQVKSDLLLVCGWKGRGSRCVMTGKVFDYIATGRPIVAISEHNTALGELIDRTGAGVVLNSREEIQRFFVGLRASPKATLDRLNQRRNPHVIHEYSATETARKYETLLYGVKDGATAAPSVK